MATLMCINIGNAVFRPELQAWNMAKPASAFDTGWPSSA